LGSREIRSILGRIAINSLVFSGLTPADQVFVHAGKRLRDRQFDTNTARSVGYKNLLTGEESPK
jgi:hypothetical protein